MPSDLITSRANPLIKQVRALEHKKTRTQRGEFLIEGIQLVLQALASDTDVRLVLVAPEWLTSTTARAAVRKAERDGIRVIRVARDVFAALAEREHPTGIAAVVGIPPMHPERLPVAADAVYVALYKVSSPGNLGAILRTADAVGARGVILIGETTDPYAPAAVNASRGALFTVPLARLPDAPQLVRWCRERNLRMIAASDQAEREFWDAELRPPLAVVLGNEGEGLPSDLLTGDAVRIPMEGAMDSLNLAVAAGVLLYEVKRQSIKDNA